LKKKKQKNFIPGASAQPEVGTVQLIGRRGMPK